MLSRRTTALAILAAILVLYGRTLAYGLVWDDYAALRWRDPAVVLGAWTGTWEPVGAWPVFYRPLSLLLYDTLFRVFGHNTAALHALNLAGLAAAAWLLRTFVVRETGAAALGLVAAVTLVAHPETPSALAAWISQLFHLSAMLCTLLAVLAWQRARTQGTWAWLPVLAWLTAGLLFKEDVLVIAPTLLVWQVIRARIVRDVRPPSAAMLALVAVWAVAYLLVRAVALRELGGYELPDVAGVARNVVTGPLLAFALVWTPAAHAISLLSAAGVAGLATLAWRARHTATPMARLLVAYGGALGVSANLPLLLISGHTRVYLLILAAALAFTGAFAVAHQAWTTGAARAQPRGLLAIGVLWLALVGTANWRHTGTFAPCAPETLARDEDVMGWDITPPALRDALARKAEACASGLSLRVE